MEQGGWALLQNCHLGLDFMDELMNIVTETESIHRSFRLWITTEVHRHFPITLLQMSIKFTNEPPQGLKAGLKRTYGGKTDSDSDDFSYLIITIYSNNYYIIYYRIFGLPLILHSACLVSLYEEIESSESIAEIKKIPPSAASIQCYPDWEHY